MNTSSCDLRSFFKRAKFPTNEHTEIGTPCCYINTETTSSTLARKDKTTLNNSSKGAGYINTYGFEKFSYKILFKNKVPIQNTLTNKIDLET